MLKTFVRGGAISLLAAVAIGLMNYYIRRMMALNLDSIDYGFFYSAAALSMLILTYTDLGLNQTASLLVARGKALDQDDAVKKVIASLLVIKIVLSTLAGGMLILAQGVLEKNYFNLPGSADYLSWFSILIITGSISGLVLGVGQGLKKFALTEVIRIAIVSVNCGVIWLTIGRYGIYGAVIAMALSPLVVIAGVVIFFGRSPYIPSISLVLAIKRLLPSIKKSLIPGRWIALAAAGVSTVQYMDSIMLTGISTLHSVALYNIALPIAQIAQSLLILSAVFTPIAAEMWENGRFREVGALLKVITISIIGVVITGGFLLANTGASEFLITLLFAEEFVTAAPALSILFLGVLIFSLAQILINCLQVFHLVRLAAFLCLGTAVMNILLNLVLVPYWDIEGAAISTFISYLCLAVMAGVAVFNRLRLWRGQQIY